MRYELLYIIAITTLVPILFLNLLYLNPNHSLLQLAITYSSAHVNVCTICK